MTTLGLDAMINDWMATHSHELTNTEAAAVGRTIGVIRRAGPAPTARVYDGRVCDTCGDDGLVTVHRDDYRGRRPLPEFDGTTSYVTFCREGHIWGAKDQ